MCTSDNESKLIIIPNLTQVAFDPWKSLPYWGYHSLLVGLAILLGSWFCRTFLQELFSETSDFVWEAWNPGKKLFKRPTKGLASYIELKWSRGPGQQTTNFWTCARCDVMGWFWLDFYEILGRVYSLIKYLGAKRTLWPVIVEIRRFTLPKPLHDKILCIRNSCRAAKND